MLKRCFHGTKDEKNGILLRRMSRSYLVPASVLLFTPLILMLALHAVGQTTDPIWPGHVAVQYALTHWL